MTTPPIPPDLAARCIIVMGIAGAGKSTLGRTLAGRMGRPFIEGDDHHPPANKAKMGAGIPLENEDRRAYIASLTATAREAGPSVLACSALNPTVRGWICEGLGHEPVYVFLHGDAALLRERLNARADHFFSAALFDSQLAALDPPREAVNVDIALSPGDQLAFTLEALGLAGA